MTRKQNSTITVELEFGDANLQYQINASGQIQDQGKNLRLQTQWTEVKLTQIFLKKKKEKRKTKLGNHVKRIQTKTATSFDAS